MGYLDGEEELSGNFLLDHWRGRYSLPRAYWINGMLIAGLGAAFVIVIVNALSDGTLSIQTSSILGLAAAAFGFALWLWSVVGIWRSADRHADRGGSASWAGVAKALVILGAFSMTGQLMRAAPGFYENARLATNNDPLGAPANLTMKGTTLALDGTIAQGTGTAFANYLAEHPETERVALTSVGGRIGDAEQIARLIKERRLDTEAIGECNSACTVVLLAGERRAVGIGGRIGFHQPDFPGLDESERIHMINALRDTYLASGLPGSFVRKGLAASPSEMWFPSESELRSAGVINWISPERIRQDNLASAEQINRVAPTRTDSLTTLISAAADGNTLAFRYRVDASRDEFDLSSVEETMREANAKQMCAQSLVPELMEAGAVYRFIYEDNAGRPFTDVSISDCEMNDR